MDRWHLDGGAGPVSLEERWTPPAAARCCCLADRSRHQDDRVRVPPHVERNGTLLYIAQLNGRPPTEFTLTAVRRAERHVRESGSRFPEEDPYTNRPDGGLDATISGDGKGETFTFKRGS